MKQWTIRSLALTSASAAILAFAAPAFAASTLTIESWRNDDLQIWQQLIIPAFE